MEAYRQRRWLYHLGLKVFVCFCLVASMYAGAHPIEYHMRPLSDFQIRRAVLSLEKIATQLGDSSAVQLPAGDMGAVMEEVTQMTTCMTVCQDALMACYSGG